MEVGLSSGLTSRQRMAKSFSAGFWKSGMGGGEVAWPICNKNDNSNIKNALGLPAYRVMCIHVHTGDSTTCAGI